jgi:hypothetical protein
MRNFFLLAAAVAAITSFPAGLIIREGLACPEVNAYLENGSLSAGDYITFSAKGAEWSRECGQVSLTPPESVVITGTNDLSGSYRVTSVSNHCITLCACP